ncbi:hypothetical protein BOTBODRAFT_144831 [Botryobasidium botryosum FD-172 SS1]|uniref:MYND-type domain-containing protein n=1 Tax=Botryobasidium botryosum (strain FD-172 SS1) TaxID=930990 RepID=A0A067MK55_BOTB1|nr:hypothetical protein BOTBODRAFT_144831 [Botryobasidium botryosum FD-172 SS1]
MLAPHKFIAFARPPDPVDQHQTSTFRRSRHNPEPLNSSSLMVHYCKACGKPATKLCSACTSKTWYCSSECQRSDWTFHIFDCNPRRPIDSSDYLALAVAQDRFPDDPQTKEDYGFNRALSAENQIVLLELFKGLILHRKVSSRRIHAWRVNGTLADGIKGTFEILPVHARGAYYGWFLQNQWVLDRSLSRPAHPLDAMIKRAWAYSGGSPALSTRPYIMSSIGAWPHTKRSIFLFCGAILSHGRPNPMEENWVTLGFCACHNEESELPLAAIYSEITERCTFEELYTAYDTSSLIALFDAKGLKTLHQQIPYLEDVLAGSPRHNKSVWNLKQVITAKDCRPDVPPLSIDYGFVNCRSPLDTELLKEVYREFFGLPDANPIKLHETAMRGQIFEYVGGLVKIKKKERKTLQRLMRNPYPLNDS